MITYSQAKALIEKTEVPVNEVGAHKIERFEVSEQDAAFFNLRCSINGYSHRSIEAGTYTRLVRSGTFDPVMSDTPAEMDDHIEPITRARGHVLIAGLGIGMVAEACLRHPDVTKVTVVELSTDVISLVGGYLEDKWGEKIEIIWDDILEWEPPKGENYGMAWFDIWDDICEDNLDDMNKLTRRFCRRADWYGHWAKEEIRRW